MLLERFGLDVLETILQGAQQLRVLGSRGLGDARPQVLRLDDVVRLAPHLFFELGHIVEVFFIPRCQGRAAVVGIRHGIILAQFFFRRRFVVVGKIAQEKEGEHVVAEIIRIHRPAQLIGDAPEGVAQLFLVGVGHEVGWLEMDENGTTEDSSVVGDGGESLLVLEVILRVVVSANVRPASPASFRRL